MKLPRVLVSHRDRFARRFLSRALSESCEVSTAQDSAEALLLLARDRFDVILSDTGPGGADVVAAVTTSSPATELVVFAEQREGIPLDALRGADAIERLPDPFDPDAVTQAVQRATERRALRAEIERLRGELEHARARACGSASRSRPGRASR